MPARFIAMNRFRVERPERGAVERRPGRSGAMFRPRILAGRTSCHRDRLEPYFLFSPESECLTDESGIRAMSNTRILLADDNRVSQRVAEAMLHSLGHELIEIRGNGREALDACLSGHFDLVLMDGYMPVMDGFEAAREIRRLERGRRTPIIALTASSRCGDCQRFLDAGIDSYLEKPVSLEQLSAALARWLPATVSGTG